MRQMQSLESVMSQALRIFVISLVRAAERRASVSGPSSGARPGIRDGGRRGRRRCQPRSRRGCLRRASTFLVPAWSAATCRIWPSIAGWSRPAAQRRWCWRTMPRSTLPSCRCSAAGLATLDFDYCFLDCANDRDPVFYDPDARLQLGHGFTAYGLSGGPEGTHAMIVTREAAALRLSHGLPIQNAFDFYDMLPGRPRFVTILAPRGAGVAMTSLHSMISTRREQTPPAFASLRRQTWFPALRDTLRLRPVKAMLLRRRLQREGRLGHRAALAAAAARARGAAPVRDAPRAMIDNLIIPADGHRRSVRSLPRCADGARRASGRQSCDAVSSRLRAISCRRSSS